MHKIVRCDNIWRIYSRLILCEVSDRREIMKWKKVHGFNSVLRGLYHICNKFNSFEIKFDVLKILSRFKAIRSSLKHLRYSNIVPNDIYLDGKMYASTEDHIQRNVHSFQQFSYTMKFIRKKSNLWNFTHFLYFTP